MKDKRELALLGLDTSSRVLTVAAANAGGQEVESSLSGPFQHAENLLPMVEGALKALKITLADLNAFAVGLGPGSFTGLRIGFAVIKGLGQVVPRPVYGFSSLDLTAQGVAAAGGRLAVLVNARRERIYAAFYHSREGTWQRETPEDEVLTGDELGTRLEGVNLVAGDALEEYGPRILAARPEVLFLGRDFWYPRARHLVRLALSRYKGMKPLKPEEFHPRYLRVSEAEEKVLGDKRTAHPA